jgi:hypothetical protein
MLVPKQLKKERKKLPPTTRSVEKRGVFGMFFFSVAS